MPTSQTEKLAVTVLEASALVSLCPRTIENYIASGVLPSRKIGRRRLVLVRDLKKFLQTDQPSASPSARPNGREAAPVEAESGIE